MDNKDNTSVKEVEKVKEKKKKTSERCYHCNKKLKMIHFTCRCNHKFCIVHQNPHSHNCEFNNKKICQEAIKMNNPQTIHQKVVKIQ
tara:strand:- start:51 stop:311 length:261 start_codon:yes stop_codon:yes gene_type:complete